MAIKLRCRMGKHRMEGKGTGGRTDLRLSGLRQNTRQAATRENRVASVGAAWVIASHVATCRRPFLCGAVAECPASAI